MSTGAVRSPGLWSRLTIMGAVAVATTTIVPAAEAGQRPLTRAAFLKAGNAICAEATRQMDRVGVTFFKSPGHPTRAETITFAREVAVPTAQHELDQLRALRPPIRDEARVKAILDASQAAVDRVRASPGLLGGDNGSERANRLARAYGLTACAN
jgi:hypothetical protein